MTELDKIQLTETQEKLLRSIPKGNERIITTKELSQLTGLETRAIRDNIQRLIVLYGFPIIGIRSQNRAGYYIATTESDILSGVRSLDKQVKEEQKRITALLYADLTLHERYFSNN